jgi:hypothetical protein
VLNLTRQPTQPVTLDAGTRELIQIWRGLDAEGRRVVLSNARAVGEVTGKLRAQPQQEERPGPVTSLEGFTDGRSSRGSPCLRHTGIHEGFECSADLRGGRRD